MSTNYKSNKAVYLGTVAIMSAAFLWSADVILIRPNLYELPASIVVFIEHIVGFILLSPFLVSGWHRIKHITTKDWISLLWICFFGGILGTVMMTKAFFASLNSETTFAEIIIVQKLQPFFTLLFAAVILREKLTVKFYIGAAVAVIASYLLMFNANPFSIKYSMFANQASWYALLAAFSFGSATVFGKRLINHLDFKSVVALRFGITSLLAFLLLLINDEVWQLTTVTKTQWFSFLLIALLAGSFAMFLYYFGLTKVPASLSAMAELFWPVSAIILDYLVNDKNLTSTQFMAILVLLAAMYYTTKNAKSSENFKFKADVISGYGRGRILNIATIHLNKISLDFAHGVYRVEAIINDKKYPGFLHFGYRETLKLGPTMELYLKDFVGNLYGVIIEVEIIEKIREVKRYTDTTQLREQVRQIIEEN